MTEALRNDTPSWWALVQGAAAALEDAAACMRDPDAKKAALGAAAHYRKQSATLQSAQALTAEPVLFVSPEQARAVTGKNRVHYTPSDNSGRYLPVRATPAGLFVQPLYTHPAPGLPDGWSIEEKCGDIIVRKYGFGGYSARKNTESIAEAVLHELALDLLAASHAQKG